jgi:hypothetical protein
MVTNHKKKKLFYVNNAGIVDEKEKGIIICRSLVFLLGQLLISPLSHWKSVRGTWKSMTIVVDLQWNFVGKNRE